MLLEALPHAVAELREVLRLDAALVELQLHAAAELLEALLLLLKAEPLAGLLHTFAELLEALFPLHIPETLLLGVLLEVPDHLAVEALVEILGRVNLRVAGRLEVLLPLLEAAPQAGRVAAVAELLEALLPRLLLPGALLLGVVDHLTGEALVDILQLLILGVVAVVVPALHQGRERARAPLAPQARLRGPRTSHAPRHLPAPRLRSRRRAACRSAAVATAAPARDEGLGPRPHHRLLHLHVQLPPQRT
mmetsp:Transcript_31906/g.83723  ORF Transcript_31906/g.83723 Transcript_31906/m.83723 type:complete len:249 (+) Transcript_31906:689-1435(+)